MSAGIRPLRWLLLRLNFSHDDIVDRSMKTSAGLGAGRFDTKTNVARTVPYILKAVGVEPQGTAPGAGRKLVAGQHPVVAAHDFDEQLVAGLGRLLRIRIDGGACLKVDAIALPGSVRGKCVGRDDAVLKDH